MKKINLKDFIERFESNDIEALIDMIRRDYNLFEYIQEDGVKTRVRQHQWSPEEENLYNLLIGVSVYHTHHCKKQLSLFGDF